MLICLHGLPGVGKSTLSGELAKITGGMILGSNYIRRQIFGCDAYTCVNVPLMPFTDQEILLSYRTILYCAELVLSCGKSVIMDATFQKKIFVDMARDIAEKTGQSFVLIKVICDEAVCKERMDRRVAEKKSDSIVGYEHHLEVKEKIFEEYPKVDFIYDSSDPNGGQLTKLKEFLRSRKEIQKIRNSADLHAAL